MLYFPFIVAIQVFLFFKPFNESVTPCNDSPGPGLGSCSSTDCEASCSPPDFTPFEQSRWPELDIVLIVILGLCFFGLSLSVTVALFLKKKKKSATVHPSSSGISYDDASPRKSPIWNRTYMKFGFVQQKIFEAIGTFCAKFPVVVLIAVAALAAGLSSGIPHIKV